MDGAGSTRKLHAKLAVFETANATVGYLGSANFTQHGWGFRKGLPANVEAGLVMRARGSARSRVLALLPATIQPAIALDGAMGERLVVAEDEAPSGPWPDFLRSVTLVPTNSPAEDRRLALEVVVFASEVAGPWTLALSSDATRTLLSGAPGNTATLGVDLAPAVLARLLVDQEVELRWWTGEFACVPVNVSLEARTELPIAPGATGPGEHLLLAYYQGRIAWDALYPESNGALPTGSEAAPLASSQVDTSRIQAYQVREFVEALHGIRGDLKAASSSPGTMRLALLGPVSPVALARHVQRAVERSERTPTAGAFQLVEIVRCLDEAATWQRLLAEARTIVSTLLTHLQDQHPAAFPPDGPFRAFQTALDGYHHPEGTG
jgi:hypothetical protein